MSPLAQPSSPSQSPSKTRDGAAVVKRRLAVIDLDGTLLGPDKQISPENLQALERLRAAGFETVIASGRHHRSIMRFEQEIGPMGWVISSAGAVVRHAVTNELLHELTIAEADALAVHAAARGAGLVTLAYHREGVFMEATESEAVHAYARRAGWKPERVDLARLAVTGIQKLLIAESPEILKKAGQMLERAFTDRLYVVWTEKDIVEFLSADANKAVGTEALARKLGVDQQDVWSFGDSNNDIEMLAWAGFSVAMDHGQPRAREAAKAVTPPGPPETAFARAVDLAFAAE